MLAIIPARGGSKGLPGKNIKPLCGKPLIAYTIEAAKKSKHVDRIIVSTDSQDIADIALQYGAEIPFYRPVELATDNAKAIDVYLYTINMLNSEKNTIEDFIVLQPTSPLRTEKDIDNSIEIYMKNNASSVISVKEADCPPEWYKVITVNGVLKNYFEESRILNRQDYSKSYVPNGAIYIFNYKTLLQTGTYYTDRTFPYVMPAETSVDIDTILDFKFAELLLGQRGVL